MLPPSTRFDIGQETNAAIGLDQRDVDACRCSTGRGIWRPWRRRSRRRPRPPSGRCVRGETAQPASGPAASPGRADGLQEVAAVAWSCGRPPLTASARRTSRRRGRSARRCSPWRAAVMIVAGVRPALKSCILRTRSAFDCPASDGTPPWLTPLVPWQFAQFAAMLRARLGSGAWRGGQPLDANSRANAANVHGSCVRTVHGVCCGLANRIAAGDSREAAATAIDRMRRARSLRRRANAPIPACVEARDAVALKCRPYPDRSYCHI